MKLKINIRSVLWGILWITLASCAISLLVAAVHREETRLCKGIEINITGVSNNFFIDRNDVKKIIASYVGKKTTGKPIKDFNLIGIETALKRDVWIKNAELYFDNNNVLQAFVVEREPVARVFTKLGSSFYLDSSAKQLPLSEKLSARVPVFTNFNDDKPRLDKSDSALLYDIKLMSMQIQADSFLMALIEQIDISPTGNFDLIPKIGNQVISFGTANEAETKFRKLKIFYKKVMPQAGWMKYSQVNLQYKNQVVAKIKGKDDVSADSMRTIQMMEIIAANASKMAEDSAMKLLPETDRKNTELSMIQQSFQRDDAEAGELPGTAQKVTTVSVKPLKPQASKQEKPKAVKPNTSKKK